MAVCTRAMNRVEPRRSAGRRRYAWPLGALAWLRVRWRSRTRGATIRTCPASAGPRLAATGAPRRRRQHLLPHPPLGLAPPGLVVHLHAGEAGRRQVPPKVYRTDARRYLLIRRAGRLPAGQDQSCAGSQQTAELWQRGERGLGELDGVHAHQPVRDGCGQAGRGQCPGTATGRPVAAGHCSTWPAPGRPRSRPLRAGVRRYAGRPRCRSHRARTRGRRAARPAACEAPQSPRRCPATPAGWSTAAG